ncbi:hypothetical protein [Bradyrhizobium jicamae]|uniref:hypothetical protein n=1 Tax=Bradyrhizobium jicamae TaxID=280332 RepID=UPI002011B6DD|nr:hypothetical protein [Bradyrhizobium jicamae]
MQGFLASIQIQRADGVLCVRADGSPWESEKEMQTRVSHWLRDQERAGHVGKATTLHGLRVSYASWWLRNGATIQESPTSSETYLSGWAGTIPGTSNPRSISPGRSSV